MDGEKIARELIEAARELTGANVGHHHRQGSDWYVDSNFINIVQHVYPGGTLEHMGFGEFYMDTPDGRLDFDRMHGKAFEGQVGRPHLLQDDSGGKVVKKAISLMERAGKSEEV